MFGFENEKINNPRVINPNIKTEIEMEVLIFLERFFNNKFKPLYDAISTIRKKIINTINTEKETPLITKNILKQKITHFKNIQDGNS